MSASLFMGSIPTAFSNLSESHWRLAEQYSRSVSNVSAALIRSCRCEKGLNCVYVVHPRRPMWSSIANVICR